MTKCKFCKQFNPTSYMVKNHVWADAGLELDDVVCLKCLEKKLKRDLVIEDFPKYKINELLFLGEYLERKRWKTK